jgi:hypothetical protein
MMKRLIMAFVGVAALACLAGFASAGDYHVGRLLVCSDCHIAHGSQSHGYATDDTVAYDATPHALLLRGETFSNACLNCHDGNGGTIPDVLGTTSSPPAHGRSAGALNLEGGVDGYTKGMGHTLWSMDPPPGHGDLSAQTVGTRTYAGVISEEGLQCTDCHRAHGAKYFRNLMGNTNNSTATYIAKQWWAKEISYKIGLANVTAGDAANPWVVEKTAVGATHYDNDNVQYLEPDTTRSMYGEWCGTCHENFHGNLTSANVEVGGEVVRHPTAGVTASASSWPTDATHRLKVMANYKDWDGAAPLGATPSCFSCHKSHGNQNRFGLVFVIPKDRASGEASADFPNPPTRLATMGEQGDGGAYRDMCRNCHGMGSFPSGNPTNLDQ